MGWLDVVIVLIVIAGAISGIRRGFLRGTLDVVIVAISLLAGAVAYRQAGRLIDRFFHLSRVTEHVLGFVIVALLVNAFLTFVLGLTVGPLVGFARKFPPLRWVDDFLGIIPGAIKGLVAAAIVVLALTLLPVGGTIERGLDNSRAARALLTRTDGVTSWAEGRTGVSLADFTIVTEPKSEAGVKLPFRVNAGLSVSPSDEAKMLQMLNQARAQHGLAPLTLDPRLQAVARAHSNEMFQQGYFAHDSPTAGSPVDRLNAAHIPYQTMGENIAYAPNVDVAERALMQSPGHRANILSPEFSRVGIGVVVAPGRGEMFTQDFAGG